jgi:glycosyltransferase involved in cell wall biosynthesis
VRLLHVAPTYLPATRYGGPIYAVHGLCRSLVRRGHQVDVFTTNVDGDHDSDVPLGSPVSLDGVSIHYFRSTVRRLFIAPAMRQALAASMGQYDAVHLHSIFLWPTYAAARAARRRGVPYIVSPRGMLVPELITRKSRFAKLLWIRAVERKTFSQAAAIHFTARSEWHDAVRMRMPLPDPFVVQNGIDLPRAASATRLPDTLLFLGRISWKKGLDCLIEALPQVPNANIIIAGNDEENLTPKLRALAARAGVLDRVSFRGPVSGGEKEGLLQTSTALVLPSHSENFGNVVLEAMAAGMPVIVSPEVGLADDVAESGAGVVTTNAPAALAGTISELLGNSALRTEMGTRGRNLVEERFTWDHVAALMEEHYERISARARAARP